MTFFRLNSSGHRLRGVSFRGLESFGVTLLGLTLVALALAWLLCGEAMRAGRERLASLRLDPAAFRPRRPGPRHAVLAAAALAGMATVPTAGADRHLEAPRPLVSMAGAERWSLRPTQPAVSALVTTGSLRGRPAGAIPEERRSVRVVYPALVEAR